MDAIKWHYFQFRKSYGYPIYLRLKEEDINPRYVHVFNELGFTELLEAETKKIPLTRSHTKILSIQNASARLQVQINGSDALDKYGHESLALQAGTPLYTYRRVGLMGLHRNKQMWDLALQSDLSQTEQMVGLRVILVRYVAMTLSDMGVLSYWGTIKDDSLVMMKQGQSFGEALFIDLEKKMIFYNGGELRLNSSLKIIRKDKETTVAKSMSREELISFLSVSSCLLSFQGITVSMKRAIYDLSASLKASYAISEASPNL
jgi:hypothetical protein